MEAKVNKSEHDDVTLETRVALLEAAVSELLSNQWKTNLDAYLSIEVVEIAFDTEEENDKAINLFWTDLLAKCPRRPTSHGMLLPYKALPYLVKSGIHFTVKRIGV